MDVTGFTSLVHRFAPTELAPRYNAVAEGALRITVSRAFFSHLLTISTAFVIIFVITLSVFIVSLIRFDHKERKLLEDSNA